MGNVIIYIYIYKFSLFFLYNNNNNNTITKLYIVTENGSANNVYRQIL